MKKEDNKEQVAFDKEMAVKMQKGNSVEKANAFQVLFSRYKANIMHFAGGFLKNNVTDAEDATQEIFTKVYERINTYDSEKSAFSTWVYKIALNYFIDSKRKNKFEVIPIESMSDESGDEENGFREFKFQFVDAHSDVFKGMVMAERAAMVREAFNNIQSEIGREVIRLFYFEQKTINEIVQELNMGENTVKVLAFRAKKEMYDYFATLEFEYGRICKKKVKYSEFTEEDVDEKYVLTASENAEEIE